MAIVDIIRQKFELADFKLKTLLEITTAINANCPAKELLQKYRTILCDDFGVAHLVAFACNQNWKKVVSVGVPEELGNNADEVSSALLAYKDVTYFNEQDKTNTLFAPFDLLIPVYHKNTPLSYILIGDVSSNQELFGEDALGQNLDAIRTLSNVIVVALENKRLYRKSLEQESMKKELEVASKMQAMLIPAENSLPANNHIQIASFYQPHSMVGGDYYDFMQLSDHEYGFCIGDVSGKGIAAAIMMSNFQANLRILFKHKVPLVTLIKELNQIVNRNAQGDRFVTFFVGIYNGKNKTLRYVNAGHNPPLLLSKKEAELNYLTKGCVGLGMLEDIPSIIEGKIQLNTGDKLFCYTDGLIEAENNNDESFGTIPIEGALTIDGNSTDIVHYLRNELALFLGEKPCGDDISMLGIDIL
ncbi:MAG: PP2C family protein-serine/threonine phosphatase [Bacteroidales bacterium]|nr:PP2C family protein-serine/threonine phosphatase [Bacteroidales bacterium]